MWKIKWRWRTIKTNTEIGADWNRNYDVSCSDSFLFVHYAFGNSAHNLIVLNNFCSSKVIKGLVSWLWGKCICCQAWHPQDSYGGRTDSNKWSSGRHNCAMVCLVPRPLHTHTNKLNVIKYLKPWKKWQLRNHFKKIQWLCTRLCGKNRRLKKVKMPQNISWERRATHYQSVKCAIKMVWR